jgi:hypothetical protein
MIIPRIRTQNPGFPDDGPITPSMLAMGRTGADAAPISPVGFNLNSILRPLRLRVIFLNTGGGGVTPWRNWIGLDFSFMGEGQIGSAGRIGLVAHELTHLLQRTLNDPKYWPAGGLRISRSRRWLGDSTNYMEVLAYLVGGAIEYDFLSAGLDPASIRELDRRRLLLSNRVATYCGDPLNATRAVVKYHHFNKIYRQNYRHETTLPDNRIPTGGWNAWLGRLGFTPDSIQHIQRIAAGGTAESVSTGELEVLLA